jgi:hypothetical protein
VRLTVSDTGPGIPKRSLKQVFDDFYRVDNDLSRTTGGTGLGLALVKKFIVAMGGQVQADTNDGPGCGYYQAAGQPATLTVLQTTRYRRYASSLVIAVCVSFKMSPTFKPIKYHEKEAKQTANHI